MFVCLKGNQNLIPSDMISVYVRRIIKKKHQQHRGNALICHQILTFDIRKLYNCYYKENLDFTLLNLTQVNTI